MLVRKSNLALMIGERWQVTGDRWPILFSFLSLEILGFHATIPTRQERQERQEMGEVWQKIGAGGGHSVSGGSYSRALGSLSWLELILVFVNKSVTLTVTRRTDGQSCVY